MQDSPDPSDSPEPKKNSPEPKENSPEPKENSPEPKENSPEPTEKRAEQPEKADPGLLRSSAITSSATFLSRILGMVREMVFAAMFGDSAAADAFFVAWRIPNFLRRLFAEGAFSQAFVPVLSAYRTKSGYQQIREFVDHVAGRLGLTLLIVTVLGVVAAPLLALLFAYGYVDDGEKFSLLVQMLRITFPYLLLISLTGFAGAILNSYGYFAAPALTPVILNLVLISSAILLSPYFSEPSLSLAWGVLIAGFLQLMFQLPFLAHLRMIPRPRIKPQHEGVKRVLVLMLPIMFSVSVGQINLLLDTVLATWIEGDGSVSWLYYSDRLMELPLGIFGIAIATVILPALSRIHSRGNRQQFSDTLDWGLRCVVLLGIPASVALIVLADPLVITLYQRGKFGVDTVGPTVMSLRAYALGLVAFMCVKVLSSAYFSQQDTRTPVRYGVIAMVSNMVLNLLFWIPLAHVGLALATSLSALANVCMLWMGLQRQGLLQFGRRWLFLLLRIAFAIYVMVLVLVLLGRPAVDWIASPDLQRIGYLLFLCISGGAAYLLSLLLVGVRPSDVRM